MNEIKPKDAAAIVLIKHDTDAQNPEFFWARRNPKIAFLGGYHAFAGGKVDAEDAEVVVKNCEDAETAKFIACAVRETFEEIGVLIVRNGEKLTKGQRASLHDDLMSKRMNFAEILAHWNLWIDAEDFQFVGTWKSPPFLATRYQTRFFLAVCPPKQTPQTFGEFEVEEFISAKEALRRWENLDILLSPPTLFAVKVLAEGLDEKTVSRFLETPQSRGEQVRVIEMNPYLRSFPLKTPTLPPATHTNCFIVGTKEFVVIDAASADENEQVTLHKFIDLLIDKGGICREIIVSHLHPDHFGGEMALQQHLREKFDANVPISAHKITAESLRGKVEFQKFIEDNEVFELLDENGQTIHLQALHTPGHARGHLCFYVEKLGFLLSSDNVVGVGSVVIAPPEGKMIDYLQSLERLKNLPNLRFLCGSHGAAVFNAKGKIEEYIAHRLEREAQVLQAFHDGAKTPTEIVEKIYVGLNPNLIPLAEKSVEAHLDKLQSENKI